MYISKSCKHCLAYFLFILFPILLLAQTLERFELVKPYERSNLEIHITDLTPEYPVPGETVRLEMQIINNQDFLENDIRVSLFKGHQLLETQNTFIAAQSSKQILFEFTAPQKQDVSNYSAKIESQNPWGDLEISNNVVTFELFTTIPQEQTDFTLNDIQVIYEPQQVPVIALEIENHGTESSSTSLEVLVNRSETYKRWIYDIEPNESSTVTIPFCSDNPVKEVTAKLNPRFYRGEINSEDNILKRDYRPSRDLAIEDLSIHAPKFEEENERFITVNFVVRNNGRLPIEEDITTEIKTSLFDDEDGEEIIINNEGGIPAGDGIYVSKVLQDILHEFYVRVVTDVHQQVMEDDEENNVSTVYYKNTTPNLRRWYSVGPSRVLNNGLDATGRLYHIAINPTDSNEIYVGAGCGSGGNPGGSGVWKTTDGGKKWFPTSDVVEFLLVNALAIDPKFTSRIILGTPHAHQDSSILWQSTDSGSSWKELATLRTRLQGKSILLFDPNISFMYLTSKNGIYVSTDNGVSWTRTLSGDVRDLVMDPNSTNTLYAAVKDSSGFHLYRTQKYGQSGSWNTISGCGSKKLPTFTQGSMDLAISGSKLFVSFMNDTTFYIYATTNKTCQGQQGPEWEKVLEKKQFETTLTEIHADPNDANNLYAYWSGPSSIWVSHDGGKTIKKVGGKAPHVDTHGFAFNPQNSKILYVLSDGGIFKSTDRGKDGTWSFIGEGILNSEIYHMAIIQSDPETVIAGTQDNGNISKQYKSNKWKVIAGAGGDGADVEIHPKKKDEFYTMHQHAFTLRKHTSSGIKYIGCGFNPCAYFSNFFYNIVPNDPERLLAYHNDTLWTAKNPVCATTGKCKKNDKSRGSSNVWSSLWKTPGTAGSVQAVAFDTKMDIYYAGTSSGLVYYSENKGSSFDTTVAITFSAGIFDIVLNPDKPNVLYISHNKSGTNRIRMMRRFYINKKLSYTTTDITFGLPSALRAYTLAVDPITPYVLYAGTQRGVYRGQSFDGGNSWLWEAYRNGMPKGTHISDLEIYQKTGLLRAATKGRGIYSIRNYQDDIFVQIAPATQNVEPGKAINYTVNIDNKGSKTYTFKLSISGLENFQYGLSSNTLKIAPGQRGQPTLSVQVPKCFPYKEWKYVFTVTAQKISNAQEFGQAKAQLVVKTPLQQLTLDSYESNDDINSAKKVTVALNQNAPWNQTPTKIVNLNIHSWSDVDFFKIQFSSNPKAECIGGSGPQKFGSFISAFRPKYHAGNISITLSEEYCRPMDVAVLSIDPSNPKKISTLGKYKTSNPITLACPSKKFQGNEFYIKVWRSEGDHVKYELELKLNPWVITLGKPLYEVGERRYNLPPLMREWSPEWRWYNFHEELEILYARIMELREFEARLAEGQLVKLRADLEITTGNFDEGLALLNQSQEIFESLGTSSAVGDVFRSRAEIAMQTGNYREAYEHINRALEHHLEIGNREGAVEDVRNLVLISEQTGDFNRPMHVAYETYTHARDQDDPMTQLETLQVMTELFLQNKDIEGAMSGIILMEKLVGAVEEPDQVQDAAEQQNRLIQILGTKGYQEIKASCGQLPEEILELKTSRFLQWN